MKTQTGLVFGVTTCLFLAVLGAYLQSPPEQADDTVTSLHPSKLHTLPCNPTDFSHIVAQSVVEYDQTFVLFTASLSSGAPWCPDSRAAEPVLFAALEAQAARSSVGLVLCRLSRQEWRGSGERPSYLTHVQRIPTLLAWAENGEADRLVEEECTDPQRVQQVIQSTAIKPSEQLRKIIAMAGTDVSVGSQTVVFGTQSCSYCVRVRDELGRANIPFQNIDVGGEMRKALSELTGQRTIPYVFVNDRFIGGCNDGPQSGQGVLPLLKSGELQKMLSQVPVTATVKKFVREMGELQKKEKNAKKKLDAAGERFEFDQAEEHENEMKQYQEKQVALADEHKSKVEELEQKTATVKAQVERRQAVVIGGGVAGLTAAIYLARAALSPVVLAGDTLGQLQGSPLVENFPGFPDGIPGSELMGRMRKQAERAGATVLKQSVSRVTRSPEGVFVITSDRGAVLEAEVLVVASGSVPRWLDLPNEVSLRGKYVHTCVHCDATLYSNKKVLVVGGGNSAIEAALQLAAIGADVIVVHRRTYLTATAVTSTRALSHPRITFKMSQAVVQWQVDKAGILLGATVRYTSTKTWLNATEEFIPVDGAFMAIGHVPTSSFLDGLSTDANGYILLLNRTMTSMDGVFGCGDATDAMGYHQAVTAAGSGAQAAIDANIWLMGH